MQEVKVVGITQSSIPGLETANDLIAYCARVSNPNNQMNTATSTKLLKYLLKNKHFSPFEMVSVTLEIKTTRDIARQILRHRSFSFQEFSQRYAVAENFTLREARIQDLKNRQNSIDLTQSEEDRRLNEDFRMKQAELLRQTQSVYNWALDNGIAKEQARAVLPEGLTQSTLYMAGTLRSWLHYIALRAENGTQKEHQEIAILVLEALVPHFPILKELVNA